MTAYYLKLYLLTIPVFFAIDLLWLGVIAKDLYQRSLAHLLSPAVNWPAAMLFYFNCLSGNRHFIDLAFGIVTVY